jgi:hypothetical protein
MAGAMFHFPNVAAFKDWLREQNRKDQQRVDRYQTLVEYYEAIKTYPLDVQARTRTEIGHEGGIKYIRERLHGCRALIAERDTIIDYVKIGDE